MKTETNESSRYARQEKGGFVLIIALGLSLMLLLLAFVFDYSRVYLAKSYLQSGIDRGLLAITQKRRERLFIEESDAYEVFNAVTNANFKSESLGYIIPESVQYDVLHQQTRPDVYEASSECRVATTFMRLIGITSLHVSATSKVTLAGKGNPAIVWVVVEDIAQERPGDFNYDSRFDEEDITRAAQSEGDYSQSHTLTECRWNPALCKSYSGALALREFDVSGGGLNYPDGLLNYEDFERLAGHTFDYSDAQFKEMTDRKLIGKQLGEEVRDGLTQGDYLMIRSANHYWQLGYTRCLFSERDFREDGHTHGMPLVDATNLLPVWGVYPILISDELSAVPRREEIIDHLLDFQPRVGCPRGSHLQGAIRMARIMMKQMEEGREGSPISPADYGRYTKAIVVISKGSNTTFNFDSSQATPGGVPSDDYEWIQNSPTCGGPGRLPAGMAMAIREADLARKDGINVYSICIDCDESCAGDDLRFNCTNEAQEIRRQRLARLSLDINVWRQNVTLGNESGNSGLSGEGSVHAAGGNRNIAYYTSPSDYDAMPDEPLECRGYYAEPPDIAEKATRSRRYFESTIQGLGKTLHYITDDLRKGGLSG